MQSIKQILLERDCNTEEEADFRIREAVEDLNNRIKDQENYGDPQDVCYDHFDLEPDYLMELIEKLPI